jgi:hypothetical protein|nr:MAG TPA: hypothetical protein [Caudoviricetes sp.]
MTAKYTRNTLVEFGKLKDYGKLDPEPRERLEALIDPELLTLPEDEADQREYPLAAYTRAVALTRFGYASIYPGDDYDEVMIREACYGPAEDGKLLLRVLQTIYTGRAPFECAADTSKLIGLDVSTPDGRYSRVVIDAYQNPRSGRFYVALARKEES